MAAGRRTQDKEDIFLIRILRLKDENGQVIKESDVRRVLNYYLICFNEVFLMHPEEIKEKSC